jgi:Trypsin-like peptidase domain
VRGDDGMRAVVRIRAPGDLAAGTGFLLAPDLVATCAHVICDAAGLDDVPDAAPAATVEVDLPLRPGRPARRARVERWWPPVADGAGDIAILRLDDPVDAVIPPLRRLDEPWGRAFRVVGFPPGREDGVWAAGAFREEQGSGWVQLNAEAGPPIGPGFSGAPVWDGETGSVVAMTVAADRGGGPRSAAYALPIEQVLDLVPEVLVNPYRGLAAFAEDDAEFFFGRDADVARCVEVLDHGGLLVVAGASGTGKSSLLQAGVAAAHRARGGQVARVRLTGAGGRAEIVRALADALAEAAPGPWGAVLDGDERADGDVLLVVDQLEDLAAGPAGPARDAVDVLLRLVEAGVRVATTSRWASFDALLVSRSAAALQNATVGLTALDRDGLRRAVAEPARRVPGPSFAPGLVERIVDDAGDEPGRLPLVQALLAELWNEPVDGRLTEEAYERVGAVRGALVRSAERTWTALDAADEATARALLVSMTRPSDTGFLRDAVHLAALTGPQRRIVEVLAAHRLVVVGPGPGGDVVELAHQALVEHWPRLREWLDADAAFLRWRDGLRADVKRWAPARDTGTLLRGAELETALGWVRRREADLAPDERALVESSRHRRGRERLLRRGAVAVLAVLVLVAGTLAAVATRSNQDLSRALDTANARVLGQLAQARIPTDAGVGTQLALAAYRSDPADADARTALAQAYVARRSTIATRPVPGGDRALLADPDVDVTVLGTATGALISENLDGPDPTFRPVPGASATERPVLVAGRGRWVVLADPNNELRVWDRTSPLPPRPLRGPRPVVVRGPDGTHLITARPGSDGTEVLDEDLAAGASTPLVQLQDRDVAAVFRTPDPNRILVRNGEPSRPDTRLTLRDTRTGAVLATLAPTTAVALDGRVTVRCDTVPTPRSLLVEDAATGTLRNRVTGIGGFTSCDSGPRVMLTADRRHVFWTADYSAAGSTVNVLDLVDGKRFSAGLPAATTGNPFTGSNPVTIAVAPTLAVHGDRAALVDGDAVDTLALSAAPTWRTALTSPYAFPVSDGASAVLLDTRGQTVVATRTSDGAVLGRATGSELGLLADEKLEGGGVTEDNAFLVVVRSRRGPRVLQFSLPDFGRRGVFDPVAAGAAGPLGSNPDALNFGTASARDRRAILVGGVLSWWSSAEHRLVAPPVAVTTDPAAIAALAPLNYNMAITDDGDLVAVREPDGLSLWRAGSDQPTITVKAELMPQEPVTLAGGRLSTLEKPGLLVQRDLATGAVIAPPIPVPQSNSGFAAVDGDGRLVTRDAQGSALDFWDPRTNRPAGRLAAPELGSAISVGWRRGALQIDRTEDFVELLLDAGSWRTHLCQAQDRAFTDVERTLLPPGSDLEPPCR